MKAPKCRLCGKQHWGGCPDLGEDVLSASEKATSESGQSTSLPMPVTEDSSATGAEDREPLSAKQRQKRFREKDPEGYRAWNRARMKARRERQK